MNRDTRPWYFWPLMTFVVGLLFGWLIIGWWLWPVEWKNALPQDLAPKYQESYLTTVAESYAANGDLQLAQERLAGWPRDELTKALTNAQENLAATNPARAANVQLLASAMSVSLGSDTAPAPAQPAPAATEGVSTFTRICTAFLWVVLALLAIFFFGYLFLRWRAAQSGTPAPNVGEWVRTRLSRNPQPAPLERRDYAEYEPEEASHEGLAEQTAAEVAAQEKARWDDTEVSSWRDVSTPTAPLSGGAPENRAGVLFDEPESIEDEELPPFVSARPETRPGGFVRTPAAEPPARPGLGTAAGGAKTGQKIGDFSAVYQMGEPDYDEAFDINDPVDGLVGQCGLQLNEPVGRNRDQAVALQAWLWDSSDPDTRVKVLMSEAAYRDTATRAQQVTEHEALPVRQGTEFELESHDLLLWGRVERVEYAEQEGNRTVFADLQVRMQVYRKA